MGSLPIAPPCLRQAETKGEIILCHLLFSFWQCKIILETILSFFLDYFGKLLSFYLLFSCSCHILDNAKLFEEIVVVLNNLEKLFCVLFSCCSRSKAMRKWFPVSQMTFLKIGFLSTSIPPLCSNYEQIQEKKRTRS